MQTTRIIRHFGIGFLATFSLLAEADYPVSVNGLTYNLTTVTDSYNNISSTLNANPWWGDSGLARSLADVLRTNLGSPNTFINQPFSPFFATGVYNSSVGWYGYNNGISGSTSAQSNSLTWAVFLGYLNSGPSAAETQAALQANIAALQGIYAIQTGTINNSLTYDCSYFDSKGFCLSTGGRYSNASNSHANTTSAMVVGGYRLDEHFRFGAYVDQNLYNTEAGSVASLRSNTPLLGVFGVWNENADQTGFEARLAAAYNNSNMDINRVQVGTSEMGYGKTGIDTLSGSATLSYGIKVVPNWMASPYFGVRHTTVSSSGYSEQATADVSAPLTYNGVTQESLTALLGIKASGRLTDQIGLQASAGLEQDMHTYTSAYSATGVDGLTAINFTPNMQKSRAVSTFGATYDVAKGHRLGLNAIWRQESFQSVDTKMAYVNYTVAF